MSASGEMVMSSFALRSHAPGEGVDPLGDEMPDNVLVGDDAHCGAVLLDEQGADAVVCHELRRVLQARVPVDGYGLGRHALVHADAGFHGLTSVTSGCFMGMDYLSIAVVETIKRYV